MTRLESRRPKEVGVYDAKTHLPRLLDEVEQGETILITRHGRPVAKLVPAQDVSSLIEAILEARKGRTPGGITTKELVNEGRKR